MLTQEQKALLEEIEKQMNSAGYATRIEDTEGLTMLRVVLDELGNDGQGSVLMEFCFLTSDDDSIPEDLNIFQIFTTIERDLPKDKMTDILTELNEINLGCVLGGFYVFEEEMQLYHKYVSVIRGLKSEEMLHSIEPAINWIASTIEEAYEELVSLCRK